MPFKECRNTVQFSDETPEICDEFNYLNDRSSNGRMVGHA
jgi:hypothetical protein